MLDMEVLTTDVLVPVFLTGANIALFMAVASKLINMLIKAFHRGEIVV